MRSSLGEGVKDNDDDDGTLSPILIVCNGSARKLNESVTATPTPLVPQSNDKRRGKDNGKEAEGRRGRGNWGPQRILLRE